jgi:FeS assembly SUF system protein
MPQDLRADVVEVLKTIYDPEIPVNIYEMGLVYDLQVGDDGSVVVTMTLTAPNCPVAGSLPKQVEQRILRVEGVTSAKIDLVFDPLTQERTKTREPTIEVFGELVPRE